jgi:SAM-dependent methyltransferase
VSNYCPACDATVDAFAPGPGGRPDARCPHCDSLERHRFLALLLRSRPSDLASGHLVLEIAPQRQIRSLLESGRDRGDYLAIDIEAGSGLTALASLTALPLPSASVDLLTCFHVLEHIPDDRVAMQEIARVLSPGGTAYIQVPHRQDRPTYEDPSASPEERVRRFGQIDHVRWYGHDFDHRLFSSGLISATVSPATVASREDIERMGMNARSQIWICRSTRVPEQWIPRPVLLASLKDETDRRTRITQHIVVRVLRACRRAMRRLVRS